MVERGTTALRALRLLVLVLPVVLVVGCGQGTRGAPAAGPGQRPASRTALQVFAAASLADAFGQMGQSFERAHPGVRVTFNFAGSQQLAQQLAQGAPADVFASANQKQMSAAQAAGVVRREDVQEFARNRLVVIYPAANPAGVRTLRDLGRPGVKLDVAAREVPAGQYSLACLEAAARQPGYGAGWKRTVLGNIVSYEENVRSVVSKVSLGEADAGIVYQSDVTAEVRDRVGRIEIPQEVNQVASYPIAVTKASLHPELARAWVEYVRSTEGQRALKAHGFIPVGR
ncbi:MAG: molybdate ABC transporter substrate-binding protein [Chloroflexota bacterium]|nr:molybdate ABC transporter substrate-binding protein [Chloroflexota bacterium]